MSKDDLKETVARVAQQLEDAAQDFHGPWGASQDPELVVLDAAKELREALSTTPVSGERES